MEKWFLKWGMFMMLAVIWGSSFKLMLIGLETLSPYQVATIRIIFAGLVLMPFSFRLLGRMDKKTRGLILLSGLLGSFFPAYLFCLAEGEDRLDSSFAGMLNSLTPVFVLIMGTAFFRLQVKPLQIAGIALSFLGSLLLFLSKSGSTGDLKYIGYIMIATMMYGLNVNMVTTRLSHVRSQDIVVLAFSYLLLPSIVILYFTGFFGLDFIGDAPIRRSVFASAFLGLSSTALASILFYILMKREGPIFSSSITYAIPIVGLVIGTYFGEYNSVYVLMSLGVILTGILLTNWEKIVKKKQ